MSEAPIAKILVIRFSSIGDIVLTTPVIRRLKQQLHGGVELHFLTKRKFAGILAHNPYVDKVHSFEKGLPEVLPDLLLEDFDYVIDLHHNIRSNTVKKKLKTLDFTFDKLNIKKWLWVNLGINLMPQVHVVDRYLDTIKAFGTEDDQKGLDYFIPENQQFDTRQLPKDFQDGYVAFAIGATHIGKRMDKEKLSSLIHEIPYPIVLLGGGAEDEEASAFVMSGLEEKTGKVWSGVGTLSLDQSADLIRQARVVITGDTGLMHIASAFRKKIVSLWGCTVPGLGMYPYRPHPASIIVEPKGRKRRPCSKLGNRCKYGKNHRCIQQIGDSEISQYVEALWSDESA